MPQFVAEIGREGGTETHFPPIFGDLIPILELTFDVK
jgi:hypothetical protein